MVQALTCKATFIDTSMSHSCCACILGRPVAAIRMRQRPFESDSPETGRADERRKKVYRLQRLVDDMSCSLEYLRKKL
ncbi:hypothetical protein DOTSEDRAFT_42054 [Dothistroma septosporum NZE10]|uniref:Uncharacterized protein n=1 Tax=Dothistroma septosporum (strain NZE10 / CBS 128990) TaxID=675120 RepID=N1PXH9_DOTSN|nr:hypothetical protein DOTSEDRAFT_42054 [Dothistroma septosporum NZE10]